MSKHEKMILKKYAGTYQLRIENPEDLSQISVLDEAHWVATSAPVEGINCDPEFLNFVDTDRNGRIRTDEVRAAQAWLFAILKNRSYLGQHVDSLKLDAIDTTHEDGKGLSEVAEYILESLSCAGNTEITLEQVRQAQSIINKSAQNGDGVIPPDAAREDKIAEFITDVIKLTGGTADGSGNKGITEAQLEAFLNQAKAWLDWKSKGKSLEFPEWGNNICEVYQIITGLEDKINQFFTQCDIVRFEARALKEMQFSEEELKNINFNDNQELKIANLDNPDLFNRTLETFLTGLNE